MKLSHINTMAAFKVLFIYAFLLFVAQIDVSSAVPDERVVKDSEVGGMKWIPWWWSLPPSPVPPPIGVPV